MNFNFNPETQFFGDKFTERRSHAHLRPRKPIYTQVEEHFTLLIDENQQKFIFKNVIFSKNFYMTKKILVIKNTQLPLSLLKTKKKSKNRHFFGSWGGSLIEF